MVVFIPFAKSHDEVVPRLACSFAHQHRSLFVFFFVFFLDCTTWPSTDYLVVDFYAHASHIPSIVLPFDRWDECDDTG